MDSRIYSNGWIFEPMTSTRDDQPDTFKSVYRMVDDTYDSTGWSDYRRLHEEVHLAFMKYKETKKCREQKSEVELSPDDVSKLLDFDSL